MNHNLKIDPLLLFPSDFGCFFTIHFKKKKILLETGFFFSTFSLKKPYIYTILCIPFPGLLIAESFSTKSNP